MDAFTHVVHRVEMLAPALIDDLEDHEALELAHQVRRQLFFLRGIRVARIFLEVLDEGLTRELAQVLPELVGRDLGVVERRHLLHEPLEIPLLGVLLGRELVDGALHHLVDPLPHLLGHVLAFEHLATLLVDHLALCVHDVVVLEDVLARDEVLLLDLLLGAFDLAREDFRLHRLVVRNLEALHDPFDPVAGEQADEIIFAGEVEARLARVALAARAAAELVVDPARLVTFGAEHVEAARLDHALAQLDVDAAAGHVGRDRDRTLLARVDDDLGLTRVLLRVQDAVRDPLALEQLAQVFRGLDRDRADQDRLTLLVALLDVAHDGLELPLSGLEDQIVLVVARHVHVGRDLDDVQVVDLDELLLLRLRRTGHAGELLVESEVVLERDRREGDVLLLDLHALLGLDRLVETLRPPAPFHDPARELVDDLDLAVLDDIVDVALVERLGLERLVQVVDELRVARVVEVVDAQRTLDRLDRRPAWCDRLVLLVVLVISVGIATFQQRVVGNTVQSARDAREVVVDLCCGLGLAGDDQRRSRLVDEDRVDLVHDRVGVAPLDEAVEAHRHVVAEVVEAELGVRAVRDVSVVRKLALGERHHVLDRADGHAKALEDPAVPFGVALREVVVDGDKVDALALERVQIQRQAGHERLALTGLHLGDVAFVEDDPAHQLHVEHPLARLADTGLADGRESFEEELFQGLAAFEPLAQLDRLAAQRVVRELAEFGLDRGDVGGLLGEPLHAAALADAQNLLEGTELGGHQS